MSKIVDSLRESYNEMVHKVSWPTFKELRASSVLVVVGTIVFALLLWVIDGGASNVMGLIYDTIK